MEARREGADAPVKINMSRDVRAARRELEPEHPLVGKYLGNGWTVLRVDTIHRKRIDYKWEDAEGRHVFRTVEFKADYEKVMDQNKALQNEPDVTKRGIQKDWLRLTSIPMRIYGQWLTEFWDRTGRVTSGIGDPEFGEFVYRKFDEGFEHFRTVPKNLRRYLPGRQI